MNKKNIDLHIPEHWKNLFKKATFSSLIDPPIKFITKEIEKNKTICPPYNEIFNAFKYCSFSKTKVVIFGQDPYFQKGVANGLAFSVRPNKPIPSSLKNIYKEIENDVGKSKNHDGCLKSWARQGVLLLNSSLTVEESKPGSHSKIGWEIFIRETLKVLQNKRNIVFILWGNHAKKYLKYIDCKHNLILLSAHPSPLSAYRGFFGSKHFSQCNKYLEKHNLDKIIW